jgi:FkbM family methyltransferase
MKEFLKSHLPEGVVVAMAKVRRSFDGLIARGASAAISVLPLRVRVLVRERFSGIGTLDYPRHPIRLRVDSETELGRLNACRKEPETIEWIEGFVKPGDVVYDIGANVGAYSFVVDRVTSGTATVYAFEPSFSTYAQLSRNIALNQCAGRVIPLHIALSDANGLVPFNYSSLQPGAALHALGPVGELNGRGFIPEFTQPVPSYRLDDLIQAFRLKPPNHMKLDVDGIELRILRGACRTLADRSLRTVLVEVEPGKPEAVAAERVLVEAGFALRSRHPHGSGENATANLVFTRIGER